MNVMPIPELIEKVSAICRRNHVTRHIDFVVYGCSDILKLEKDLESIDTLRKIDIFDFDSIHNEYLLEDIRKYGKQIY